MTVFTETESWGTNRRKTDRSGRTSALRARYGLEQSHAKAAWRAGAMDGGSTASFRCRPPPSEAIDFFDHHTDVSSSSPVGNLTNPILGPMNGLWRMLGALPVAGRGRQGGQRGAVEKAV
jgi:hypothetical protein